MKFSLIFNILIISLFFYPSYLYSNEAWILDKNLSTIKFELPILFANNIIGEFKDFEGIIEIDKINKKNNKAIFAVQLSSIEMNYKKYKNLLLGNIFFDVINFPIALVDTRKFSYSDEKLLNLQVKLTIKGITNTVPLEIEINHLAVDLVQIKTKLTFSRTSFQVGLNDWSSTAILKDDAKIITNLFLFKE
jgi:polyisoprenoid-binding protein YceI